MSSHAMRPNDLPHHRQGSHTVHSRHKNADVNIEIEELKKKNDRSIISNFWGVSRARRAVAKGVVEYQRQQRDAQGMLIDGLVGTAMDISYISPHTSYAERDLIHLSRMCLSIISPNTSLACAFLLSLSCISPTWLFQHLRHLSLATLSYMLVSLVSLQYLSSSSISLYILFSPVFATTIRLVRV